MIATLLVDLICFHTCQNTTTITMLPQRVAQQSLRRCTYTIRQGYNTSNTLAVAVQPNVYRFAAPAAIALGAFNTPQRRLVAAASMSEKQAQNNILANQRLNRPVAPHLAIYQPQITWYLSALNRITGCTVSGLFYLYGALYLVAPYLGWHVETQVLAASFAAWPVVLQVLTKVAVALPFTFHR